MFASRGLSLVRALPARQAVARSQIRSLHFENKPGEVGFLISFNYFFFLIFVIFEDFTGNHSAALHWNLLMWKWTAFLWRLEDNLIELSFSFSFRFFRFSFCGLLQNMPFQTENKFTFALLTATFLGSGLALPVFAAWWTLWVFALFFCLWKFFYWLISLSFFSARSLSPPGPSSNRSHFCLSPPFSWLCIEPSMPFGRKWGQ